MKKSPQGLISLRVLGPLLSGAFAIAIALPVTAQDNAPSDATPPSAPVKEEAKGPAKGPQDPNAKRNGPKGPRQKGKKVGRGKVNAKEAMAHYRAAMNELEAANETEGDEKEIKKARKAARKALKKARKELRLAHAKDVRKVLRMKKKELKAVQKQLREHAKKLRADRKERGEKRREELKKEWGQKVKLAAVHAELTRHAWRVARLQRLIAIAEASDRKKAAARAQELLDKENESHLERLKEAAARGRAKVKSDKAPAQPTAPAPTKPVAPAPAAPEGDTE